MKINQGVEWAVHACAVLGVLWPDRSMSVKALAELHGLPEPYMAKQLPALRRAGILSASRGKGGGYRLAMPPGEVTFLAILRAIDGTEPMFRCDEIRQRGPCALKRKDCKAPCEIAAKFADAEKAYRDSLAGVTVLDIMTEFMNAAEPEYLEQLGGWVDDHAQGGAAAN